MKELCGGDAPPFAFHILPRMREDVPALNSLGIVVWDLREDNYMGGRVIDFSEAITAPHLKLCWDQDLVSQQQVMEWCTRDMLCFYSMVAGWNEDNPDQAFWPCSFPNPDYIRRLRPLPHSRDEAVYYKEGARFTAAAYGRRKHARRVVWVAKEGRRSRGGVEPLGRRGVRKK